MVIAPAGRRRTDQAMPRRTAPAPPHARHRAPLSLAAPPAAPAPPPTPAPTATPAADVRPAAAAALTGSWAFGGHAPSVAELGELYLNTDLLGRRQPLHLTTAEDLAPLHAPRWSTASAPWSP